MADDITVLHALPEVRDSGMRIGAVPAASHHKLSKAPPRSRRTEASCSVEQFVCLVQILQLLALPRQQGFSAFLIRCPRWCVCGFNLSSAHLRFDIHRSGYICYHLDGDVQRHPKKFAIGGVAVTESFQPLVHRTFKQVAISRRELERHFESSG